MRQSTAHDLVVASLFRRLRSLNKAVANLIDGCQAWVAGETQEQRIRTKRRIRAPRTPRATSAAPQHPRLRSSACFARWENVDHLDSGLPFEIGKQVNGNRCARRDRIIEFGLIARNTFEIGKQIHPFFLAFYHPTGINRHVGPMNASAFLILGTNYLKGGGVIGLPCSRMEGSLGD